MEAIEDNGVGCLSRRHVIWSQVCASRDTCIKGCGLVLCVHVAACINISLRNCHSETLIGFTETQSEIGQ